MALTDHSTFNLERFGEGTRRVYASALHDLSTWLASNDQIPEKGVLYTSRKQIESWVLSRAKSLKHSTLSSRLSGLRAIFSDGPLENPTLGVRAPNSNQKSREVLFDESGLKLIIEEINITSLVGLRDRAILGLILEVGLKVSDLVTLEADSYLEEGQDVFLLIPGEESYKAPLTLQSAVWLAQYLKESGIEEGPMFRPQIGSRNPRRLDRRRIAARTIREMVYRRQIAAGLPPLSPQRLRATCFQRLIQAGKPGLAQSLARHRQAATTMRYASFTLINRQDLDRYLRIPPPADTLRKAEPQLVLDKKITAINYWKKRFKSSVPSWFHEWAKGKSRDRIERLLDRFDRTPTQIEIVMADRMPVESTQVDQGKIRQDFDDLQKKLEANGRRPHTFGRLQAEITAYFMKGKRSKSHDLSRVYKKLRQLTCQTLGWTHPKFEEMYPFSAWKSGIPPP